MSNSLAGSHGAHKSELNQVKRNTLVNLRPSKTVTSNHFKTVTRGVAAS